MIRRPLRRKGNVLLMTALLMTALISFLAFAIDIGYIYAVRAELQRTADAAAIAATWELIDKDGQAGTESVGELASSANYKAAQFASLNHVASSAPSLA